MRQKFWAVIIFIAFLIFSYIYIDSANTSSTELADLYINNAQANSQVQNIVTAIYLDYRIFDTIFEALLLLIAVIAIFQFIKLEIFENNLEKIASSESIDFSQSSIQRTLVSIIYPIFIIFGIYIITRGTDSPGGGFQGGAIMTTIIMCRYLIVPNERYDYKIPYTLEKIFYSAFLILVFIFLSKKISFISTRQYIQIANVLLGIKVACGLSAIFLRFIYFGKEEAEEIE
ncbi:MAG: MnhB domain-containing protein [Andreesenia angusta]|nr:MnhB domain-containing protein [Andreesenia angusta]